MDSMRALNTSLPSTGSPKKMNPQPPEQLLQAFKAAALSVTTLYKTAATDRQAAEEAGYQYALEDLLAYLDKEHLLLGEGEGSRVRQWITDRISGTTTAHGSSESDEEPEEDKRARSSSPTLERKASDVSEESIPTANIILPSERPESAPPTSSNEISRPVHAGDFTFRSSHPYPNLQDTDMDTVDASMTPANAATVMPSMRLEVHQRTTRNNPRHPNRNNRNSTNNNLGPGAGVIRRMQLDDLFDLGSFGNGKDKFGGGKRGRFS